MTTKPKAAGQRSQPGSPPAESADAGRAWRETLLRIKAAVERPDKLLTPPPLKTPLADLKRVRTLLDPYSAESSLLKSLLQPLVVAFLPVSLRQLDDPPAFHAAYTFAGRVTGDARREQTRDVLAELLIAVDQGIVRCLSDPHAPRTTVFPTSDFGPDGIRPLWLEPRGSWFHSGLIDKLSADHPFLLTDPALYLELDEGPGTRRKAVVLGRAQPAGMSDGDSPFSPCGLARPFHFTADARTWTRLAREHQVRHRLESRLSADQYAVCQAALEKLENPKPPKMPPQPLPPPEPTWPSWTERVVYGLDALLRTPAHLTPPPADAALDDLLAVRAAFSVNDAHPRPIPAAAAEWSARLSGGARRDVLYSLLPPLYHAMDAAITREVEAILLWASTRRQADGEAD